LIRPAKNKTPITGGDFLGETTSGKNYVAYPGAFPEPPFHNKKDILNVPSYDGQYDT